jgi:DNA-binding NtrC family response regulator
MTSLDDLPFHEAKRAFVRGYLTRALERYGGSRTRTAAAIGLQRTYLQRLIQEYDVAVPQPTRERRRAA